MINKQLWCFWADHKTMSSTRSRALEVLRQNCGVNLILVTDDNYLNYESKDFPIHESYVHLSDTHKSEYMRFYLCHNYGGGYADVKPFTFNWEPYFDLINDFTELVGSPELSPDHIAAPDCKIFYRDLVSVHHFIMKPKSSISESTILKIHELLDFNKDQVFKNPGTYHPRAVSIRESPSGVFQDLNAKFNFSNYPFDWNEFSGKVFHKIQYLNRDKINRSMSSNHNIFSLDQYR